jgi:aryl-alcohol dehydrogenase-like predicted oxidoreductase
MKAPDARRAGTFRIGGELEVARLGFGALRVTGRNNWGDPPDRVAAVELLRSLPSLGVSLIDTADSYGPETSEQLIREALHPYPDGLLIATKGGYARPRPQAWVPLGRPEHLQQAARLSARRLGVDTIDLWQLHRIDPLVPRDEQFDAIRSLRDDGVIRHVGLSEVDIEDIEAAEAFFPVATVQNHFNLIVRRREDVLDYCERRGIGFMPFFPLSAGALAADGSVLTDIARRVGATPGQLALAWILKRSTVMLPIPGTGKAAHLRENVAAAGIALSDDDFAALDAAGRNASTTG